jgi:lysyl-tRNA synthetase, class I
MIDDDWLPLAGFCDVCGRDELDFAVDASGGEGRERVAVHCRLCGHDGVVDLAAGGNLKLPWRIDWPMRWAYEGVCFEPGGKDHSTAGGSFDTAKHIVAEVYGGVAPSYIGYDFVRIKGRAGKISSSSGDVVTVADCLEIYEPALLRYIFASTRPNTEFQISFDLDVIKIYEEYDRARRLAHEADDGSKGDQKRQVARRTLQLASVDHRRITPGSPLPAVPGFRHLTTILQVYGGDLERTLAHYVASGEITSDEERAHTLVRARCAWNWLVSFAPDDFRYELREAPIVRELSGDEAVALGRLVAVLEASPSISEDELVPHMRGLCEGTAIDNKGFLPVVYDLLLAREKGPKVTTLITTMGIERAIRLLRPSVAARAG